MDTCFIYLLNIIICLSLYHIGFLMSNTLMFAFDSFFFFIVLGIACLQEAKKRKKEYVLGHGAENNTQ